MKKVYILLGLLFIGYGVYYVARMQDKKTDGFYVQRIASIFPDDPKWDIHTTSQQVARANQILNQPYSYLAHGFQCYAFVSQDNKYILKFIRQQRLQPSALFTCLPNILFFKTIKEQKTFAGKKRANYLFRSLKVAYEDVPEETGLEFVHLNKTKGIHPVVTIYDKAGSKFHVALDDHEFVLQKKALPIKETISELVQEGKVEEAKERIDQIFTLLETCAKKGIADMDNQLIRKNNLGFLPGCAIYIDTGKITRKEAIKTLDRFSKDLDRLKPLHEWLQQKYPDLALHFEAKQKKCSCQFLNLYCIQ